MMKSLKGEIQVENGKLKNVIVELRAEKDKINEKF